MTKRGSRNDRGRRQLFPPRIKYGAGFHKANHRVFSMSVKFLFIKSGKDAGQFPPLQT